jgi:hypothetical protein
MGDFLTNINGNIEFNPRFVTHAKLEDEYVLSLAAAQMDNGCIFRAIVSFTIEDVNGRQVWRN